MKRKNKVWQAPDHAVAAMPDVSGNSINGLGETEFRSTSPFFWHEPKYHEFGDMQGYTLGVMYGLDDGPEICEAFRIKEKYVIVVGVAHNFEEISQAPSTPEHNNRAIVEIGKQYTRAATVAAELNNYIRNQGHQTTCHPGPTAMALIMIPAAIAAGLGELGKHGSLINRKLGSSFRLSAVTTDLPLAVDQPDVFGGDDFCIRCQVCHTALETVAGV